MRHMRDGEAHCNKLKLIGHCQRPAFQSKIRGGGFSYAAGSCLSYSRVTTDGAESTGVTSKQFLSTAETRDDREADVGEGAQEERSAAQEGTGDAVQEVAERRSRLQIGRA